MTKALIIFLFFIPNAFGFIFNTAFWKSSGQTDPKGLSLTHVANNRLFNVSWTAGSGNGGAGSCLIQFQYNSTTWNNLPGTFNCDSTTVSASVGLPGSNSWGVSASNWNATGVTIRLVRASDNYVFSNFTQRLTCSTKTASNSATPNVDENCNFAWDDTTTTNVSCNCRFTWYDTYYETYYSDANCTGNIVSYTSTRGPYSSANYLDEWDALYTGWACAYVGCVATSVTPLACNGAGFATQHMGSGVKKCETCTNTLYN